MKTPSEKMIITLKKWWRAERMLEKKWKQKLYAKKVYKSYKNWMNYQMIGTFGFGCAIYGLINKFKQLSLLLYVK